MITLDVYKDHGFIASWPFIPNPTDRWAYVNAMKKTSGFVFKPSESAWITLSPDVVLDLDRFDVWKFIKTTPAAQKRVDEYREKIEEILNAKYAEHAGEYSYQKSGTLALVHQKRGILADDMGLGKTKQALDAAQIVGACAILVVAPKTLTYNWAAEVRKWMPEHWSAYVMPDSRKERDQVWDEVGAMHKVDVNVVIINYEKLRLADWDFDIEWDVVILDEAQKVKNPKTATHKAVKKLKSDYLWALSGTPMEIRLEELYGVMSIVRPGLLGSWTRFREHHVVEDAWGNVIGVNNLDLLKDRISPWMTRRTKKEVLTELPDKLYNSVYIELSPEERVSYNLIKNDFYEWLKDAGKEATGMNALVQLLRLQQFTSSPDLLDYEDKGSKFAELEELIAGWEGQIMVFSRFSEMANRLVSWLKLPDRALISGGVPSADRLERVKDFNDGKLGKTLVSTDAGAYGLNVTSADLVVHYDQLWNPGKLWQREDRLHRIGQKKVVNVVNLVCQKTVDEGMLKTLDIRRELFHDIIDGADEVALKKLGMSQIKKIAEGG